jgi:LytS/YehU family sensor histidine kinase
LALLLIVMPVPFFFALWVYEQWKWLRTLQADKSKAELALLKTQVNPHFFFNTLNNLYSLTVQHSDKAPEVILKLSDMMRYTIYEGAKEFVPLRDEVTYLESYIALHRIRYHKTVDIRFDHTMKADVSVAPLLFIILLENAFKHGVASLPTSPYVNMQLTSNAEEVSFILENNFDPGEVSQQDGIGLGNLRRRLELIYPGRYEFVVTANKNIFRATLNIQML